MISYLCKFYLTFPLKQIFTSIFVLFLYVLLATQSSHFYSVHIIEKVCRRLVYGSLRSVYIRIPSCQCEHFHSFCIMFRPCLSNETHNRGLSQSPILNSLSLPLSLSFSLPLSHSIFMYSRNVQYVHDVTLVLD